MSEIHFIDTTVRDGPQSLWALGMRTGMMIPVAEPFRTSARIERAYSDFSPRFSNASMNMFVSR